MHDPKVVAFEIRRPWPQHTPLPATGSKRDKVRWRIRLHHQHVAGCENDPPHSDGAFPWYRPSSYSAFWRLAGRDFYWPAMLVIWHCEPDGHDALAICRKRTQRPDGTWKFSHGWRWHVHHWRIQVPPLQALRRQLLTRCAWCGGRSRKGDPVNHSHSWDGPRGRWWQGEPGLYHHDCSSVKTSHSRCLCVQPVTQHDGWGRCARCDGFRAWGYEPNDADRMLRTIPRGRRIPEDMRSHLERIWREARETRK